MRTPRVPRAAILTALACLFVQAAWAERDLTLEERVAAQAAIERVFYAHQIGATRSFDEAVPREVLEKRVRKYLTQSAALERLWRTPVTAEMLETELRRIASRTRMPARLQELFAALDDDAFLIQECLVRPILVDRLAREFFAFDARVHAGTLHDAEKIHDDLTSGRLAPTTEHAARNVVVLQRQDGARALPRRGPERNDGAIELEPEEFDRWRGLAPSRIGVPGAVYNEREAYTIRVVLEEHADRAVIAIYEFPKRTWDDWWPEATTGFGGTLVGVVASESLPLPEVAKNDGRACDGDSWDNGILDASPDRRSRHTAVWTGSQMIVWSGYTVGGYSTRTGFCYEPATDSWTATSTVDAPSGRIRSAAVWTGDLMIVWGGRTGEVTVDTGGRYDPASDTWTPTSLVGVPDGREVFSAVWTGDVMIVWGGSSARGGAVFNTGGRYDPATDSWLSTSTAGAPTARGLHTAVWTGRGMVVWGGTSSGGYDDTGGVYYPAVDSWVATSTLGAPLPRRGHSAVWTGEEMIVWGGTAQLRGSENRYYDDTNTGGRYDPATNSWTSMTTVGAPEGRTPHTAVWTGSKMIVWGGGEFDFLQTGGRYDPAMDSWAATSTLGAPEGRNYHTAVWAGEEMIIWGGLTFTYTGGYRLLGTGGRYDPVSDSWTPTYSSGAPSGRGDHTAVWTGNEMIVWGGGYWTGGDGYYIKAVDTGGRYNPVTDSWSPTPTANVPDARYGHSVVWTGNEMIVWGGGSYSDSYDTGGRYDPIGDLWTPTSLVGAPSERRDHTAVWTGDEMIVWGGLYYDTGARYDPASDSWTPVSVAGAPEARHLHTAVWTGTEMIVWGGADYPWYYPQKSGGRYDPLDDSWTVTSIADAPDARFLHTALWNGSEMVVWGGSEFFYSSIDTGGRYDPATDSWDPTSIDGAPLERQAHTAVWTGNRMIVWGGGLYYEAENSGGQYDPHNDSWQATSLDDAPSPRDGHSAIWTGDEMIVWGGFGPHESGGRYDPEGVDHDGDGHGCAIDCDDGDPGVFASPGEIRGLRFTEDETTFQWIASVAGEATVYDIVRGVQSELPVGSGPSETCLASDYAPGGGAAGIITWTDAEAPDPGATFWYLVRATNACGEGTYGSPSVGGQRMTEACQP